MHINSVYTSFLSRKNFFTNYAIKLNKAKNLLSILLTSTTFLVIEQLISLVVFTLSVAPKLPPCVTTTPTYSNSTSPKWS